MGKLIVDQLQKPGGTPIGIPGTPGSANKPLIFNSSGNLVAGAVGIPSTPGTVGKPLTFNGSGDIVSGAVGLPTTAGTTGKHVVFNSSGDLISSAYTLPTTDGTSGQFLTTNGAGSLSFTDITIPESSGGFINPIASGLISLGNYFTDINWSSTDTQSYGWLIQRTNGVATGVGQFALIQGGYRSTSLGGCKGTLLPFQVNANNTITVGTATDMWTNSSSTSDFSTCSLITDNISGGFHYSGNIPWPGNSSHTMGWGTGLLNANNTAGTFTNSGTTTSQGIHDHNGQYFGLPDSDGYGWYGCNNGYSQDDSRTRIHSINYLNPNSPSISTQNPSANTSTSPVMQFILQANSTTANTAISGSCHWRDGSSYVNTRVFDGAGSYQDYNSNADWGVNYASGQYYGFALSTGSVIVYHKPLVYLYSSYSSRTSVTSVCPFTSPDFMGACFIPDGIDSWLVLSSASANTPILQKWSINPSTYVWTKNWSTVPLIWTGTSYLKLNKLPNDRIMLSIRKPAGLFEWYIFNRSQFPI